MGGLRDAPRRCKLRIASIYEANSNFHRISWSPTRFRLASFQYPFLENAICAVRNHFIPLFQPARQKIALYRVELFISDQRRDIKRGFQESEMRMRNTDFRSENVALLYYRCLHEKIDAIINMINGERVKVGRADLNACRTDLFLHVLFMYLIDLPLKKKSRKC